MAYTVHEVAKLSGVTIKTLYHYQKIGLLMPESIAENGYRYYGDRELEQLQQILFYRELDFPLEKIKAAMQNEPSRLRCLYEQKALLMARQQRISSILHTLEEAIIHASYRYKIVANCSRVTAPSGFVPSEKPFSFAHFMAAEYQFSPPLVSCPSYRANTVKSIARVMLLSGVNAS
ncbi:MAG: MerR family transcriptional regulator, partial [Intestinibacillus sp.]